MEIEATPTLRPLGLDRGESCAFILANGKTRQLRLIETGAEILYTTLPEPKVEHPNARTFGRMSGPEGC